MNYSFYGRAIGISTLKSIVYICVMIAGILFLADTVPPSLYLTIHYIIFFLNTFMFSEWIFRGREVKKLELFGSIILTYAWDLLLITLFMSWLVEINLFTQQNAAQHGIFFGLHIVAMWSALYIRKRFHAKSGLAEGLEA